MKLDGGRGKAYLKLKRYERVFFLIVLVRGGMCYIKLAGGGGRAIKLAGKLYPVLCMLSFNCSVPNWLSAKLDLLSVFYESMEKAIWLQFPLATNDTEVLPAVWLVGEALAYAWSRRKNKERLDLRTLTAALTHNANIMRKSERHGRCGEKLHLVLTA